MERVADAAFGPEDRIGQLTMRNLDIADSRTRLEQYAAQGIVSGETAKLMGSLEQGEGAEIAGGGGTDTAGEVALDRRGVRRRHRLAAARLARGGALTFRGDARHPA
jgi:argininosuccinate synthase